MGMVFKVSDLTESLEGQTVTADVMVKEVSKGTAANGSDFLNVTLADKDEDIKGKLWGAKESDLKFFEENRFARVAVKVNMYKGNLQVIVNKYGNIPEEEFNEKELKQGAPESEEKMILELEGVIGSIEDPAIKKIVENRYERVKDKFTEFPAAMSNHHNYPGGLLYHTLSMVRLAKGLFSQYPEGKLDKDVVVGAIILHDMDKVVEYTDPLKPQFAEIGKLMGHIFLSGAETYAEARDIKRENPDINTSKIKYLVHAILAHHGKKEWGSPVVPATIEAEIVHQIDMMDSRMNMKY